MPFKVYHLTSMYYDCEKDYGYFSTLEGAQANLKHGVWGPDGDDFRGWDNGLDGWYDKNHRHIEEIEVNDGT